MDQNDYSNIEVEDGEGYSSNKVLGKTEIIFKALQKCMEEGSKEMGESGVIVRIINNIRYEYPSVNQREIFINSIKMLWSLMFPIIEKQHIELYKEKIGDFEEVLNLLNKSYYKQKELCRERLNKHKNMEIYTADKKDINSDYESKKVRLYNLKLDFCITIINKENWFGENYA